MKNRVKQYKFTKYILHTIAAQIRLSFNHLIKEPWFESKHRIRNPDLEFPELDLLLRPEQQVSGLRQQGRQAAHRALGDLLPAISHYIDIHLEL